MKVITIHRVEVQFDANQITQGTAEQQAGQAIEQINLALQRQPFGLGAQIIVHRDEIEVETHNEEP